MSGSPSSPSPPPSSQSRASLLTVLVHRIRLTRFSRRPPLALVLLSLLALALLVPLLKAYALLRRIPQNHLLNLAHIHGLSAYLPTALGPAFNEGAWFSSGVDELLARSNPPLASYSCPSLHSEGERGLDNVVNPFLLVATFSTGTARAAATRAMLRGRRLDGVRDEDRALVRSVFVLGALKGEDGDGREAERREMESRLEAEQALWGDLMRLPEKENMDDGKTYYFLRHLVKEADAGGIRPQFIMKTDEDTVLNMPNVLDSFMPLDCNEGVYWGTSMGSCIHNCFAHYFQGMAYAMSWPLVEHLARSNLSFQSIKDTEDARTGGWVRSVDARTKYAWEEDPARLAREHTLARGGRPRRQTWEVEGARKGQVRRVELGRRLGGAGDWWMVRSWKAIGFHGPKDEEGWLKVWNEMREAWAAAGERFIWWGGNELAMRP